MNRMTDFPYDLRRAMTAAGYVKEDGTVNVNRLARELDPEHVESTKRKVRRWLSPVNPSLPSRDSLERLAALLGKPVSYFVWEGGPKPAAPCSPQAKEER